MLWNLIYGNQPTPFSIMTEKEHHLFGLKLQNRYGFTIIYIYYRFYQVLYKPYLHTYPLPAHRRHLKIMEKKLQGSSKDAKLSLAMGFMENSTVSEAM
jgi:hypothetical protein